MKFLSGWLLLIIGVPGLPVSGGMLLLSILGFIGIAADTSLEENRQFAKEFLMIGLPLFIVSVLSLFFGIKLLLKDRKTQQAESA